MKKWATAGEGLTVEAASAHLRKFFVNITTQIDREYATIQAVFPEPAAVLTAVLEKVFEWREGAGEPSFSLSIRRLLEAMRIATERSAPETYLVVVAEAFDRTRTLVDHLSGKERALHASVSLIATYRSSFLSLNLSLPLSVANASSILSRLPARVGGGSTADD
jgi:hypothetical protein